MSRNRGFALAARKEYFEKMGRKGTEGGFQEFLRTWQPKTRTDQEVSGGSNSVRGPHRSSKDRPRTRTANHKVMR